MDTHIFLCLKQQRRNIGVTLQFIVFLLFPNFQKANGKPSISIRTFPKPKLVATKPNMNAWDSKTLREVKYNHRSRGLKYVHHLRLLGDPVQ
jgi:hypothetical protein